MTLATLTAALGAPDLDSGWADPSLPQTEYLWPGCPGVRARVVAWTGVLGVVFTDWDMTSEDPRTTIAGPVSAGAGLHHQSPVPTAEGVRAGDRLGDVRDIYGTRLHVSEEPDDAVGLYSFGIDEQGSPLHRSGGLRGWVYWPDYPTGIPPAGPPDDTWQIGSVTAGVSCETR